MRRCAIGLSKLSSAAAMYFDSPKPLSQKSWKPPEIRKHEIELSGQINVIGL